MALRLESLLGSLLTAENMQELLRQCNWFHLSMGVNTLDLVNFRGIVLVRTGLEFQDITLSAFCELKRPDRYFCTERIEKTLQLQMKPQLPLGAPAPLLVVSAPRFTVVRMQSCAVALARQGEGSVHYDDECAITHLPIE